MLLLLFPSELIVHWGSDFYEFSENELAAVELVTDSEFEVALINILGVPMQIPGGHPNHFTSLPVSGPGNACVPGPSGLRLAQSD